MQQRREFPVELIRSHSQTVGAHHSCVAWGLATCFWKSSDAIDGLWYNSSIIYSHLLEPVYLASVESWLLLQFQMFRFQYLFKRNFIFSTKSMQHKRHPFQVLKNGDEKFWLDKEMSGGLKSGLCFRHINSIKDLSGEIHDRALLKTRKRPPTNSH